MKKACVYCGKVHSKGENCDKRPKNTYGERGNREDLFRWSYAWKCKREHILKRDIYLCRACFENLPFTVRRFNSEELSVHHIQSLKTNWELRLEDENLITLCRAHHELAESGEIPAEKLLKIVKNTPPRG
jgi:hypothetical protein